MSEIKYGLISKVDGNVLERVADLIGEQFPNKSIEFTEVGVYSGLTGNAITKYFTSKRIASWWVGVDNFRDGEPMIFTPDVLIEGNSNEVYNQIKDNSQHLIFIDALHTFPAVVADFFCYAPKVKVGGYLAFHDSGKHLDPLSGWQGVGDKNDPDFCLGGVRRALNRVGLLYDNDPVIGAVIKDNKLSQWQLIFDEADPEDAGGGITVFKKLY